MNDPAPADAIPRPYWQFSLRALFTITAAVAALVALWLADATVFVIELVATFAFGLAFYLAGRRAVRKSGLRRVRELIAVIALIGVALTSLQIIWHSDTLLDAMLIVGITTAAVGGLLWAIAKSSPNESVPIPHWLFAAFAVLVFGVWAALHRIESDFHHLVYTADMDLSGRFRWSWSKSRYQYFGPVRLCRTWTIDIQDHQGRAATDTDLESIADFDVVATLELRGSNISDEGLRSIARLTRIERLDLAGTRITDAGLIHLKSLHNLAYLDVRGTKVSYRAVEKLCADLPNLKEAKSRPPVFSE